MFQFMVGANGIKLVASFATELKLLTMKMLNSDLITMINKKNNFSSVFLQKEMMKLK